MIHVVMALLVMMKMMIDDGEFDYGVGNNGGDGRDFYLLFVYRSLQWRWSEIRWFFA